MAETNLDELPPYPLPERSVLGGEWLGRRRHLVVAAGVFVFTATAGAAMMPPARYPELAYIFAVPAVFWASFAPSWRLFLWVTLGAQAVAWAATLIWLRHVTWAGPLLLGPFIGLWTGVWFVAVRWVMPRVTGRPWQGRVFALFGLAGGWVVVEWTRSWLLSGFPWLPLAATQWEQLSVLQPAAYAGAWAVSFVLIVVNVSFAAYARQLLVPVEGGSRARCPEFLAAMGLLLGCLLLTIRETMNRGRFHVPWATVGVVQPAIPQAVKWDPAEAEGVLAVLDEETKVMAAARPDLLLWPEATTPLAVKGDPGMARWTAELARASRAPLVLGSVAFEQAEDGGQRWWNGVFVVTPEGGVENSFYAKRRLVPFGEYVPLRPVLGWLEKVAPVGGDFERGKDAGLLRVEPRGVATRLGPLICYEDIFPRLARESVAAGADVLVVNTNNGWFGEEAMAYQHAAHSVLRAVETRRPVLRAGNAGWSGWIDEVGAVRAVLTRDSRTGELRTAPPERRTSADGAGTVYFRGGAVLAVSRDARYAGVLTPYVRWGDWFVGLAAALAAGTWFWLRRADSGRERKRV